MKTKSIHLLLSASLLFSCGSAEDSVDVGDASQDEADTTTTVDQELEDEYDYNFSKQAANFIFKDFSLKIDSVDYWKDEEKTKSTGNDTLWYALDLGSSIEGKVIEITQTKYSRIEIYQQFENSISISNEGPHCDLIDWKHHTTGWLPITTLVNDKLFMTNTMADKDRGKFPATTISDLRKEVFIYCGEEWAQLLDEPDLQTINDYPSGVSNSKTVLKLRLTDKETDKVTEKILVFMIPMGC